MAAPLQSKLPTLDAGRVSMQKQGFTRAVDLTPDVGATPMRASVVRSRTGRGRAPTIQRAELQQVVKLRADSGTHALSHQLGLCYDQYILQ